VDLRQHDLVGDGVAKADSDQSTEEQRDPHGEPPEG
jgi:hypothetical protein